MRCGQNVKEISLSPNVHFNQVSKDKRPTLERRNYLSAFGGPNITVQLNFYSANEFSEAGCYAKDPKDRRFRLTRSCMQKDAHLRTV